MCSDKKNNGGGSICVWFVVLGLALLIGAAAAKRKQGGTAVNLPGWYCEEKCHGKQDYIYCYRWCRASPSPSSGAALRLASHRGTGEEGTRGGGGVGLVGEGVGREEERKQGDIVVHPPWSCELECEDIVDPDFDPDSYMPCVRECDLGFRNTVHRSAEGEEEREGGGAGLLAMPAEHAGREKEEEEEGKRKKQDAAVNLRYNREDYCYDLYIRKKGLEFPKCMKSCVAKVN